MVWFLNLLNLLSVRTTFKAAVTVFSMSVGTRIDWSSSYVNICGLHTLADHESFIYINVMCWVIAIEHKFDQFGN